MNKKSTPTQRYFDRQKDLAKNNRFNKVVTTDDPLTLLNKLKPTPQPKIDPVIAELD